MTPTAGRLVHSRAYSDPAGGLAAALDRSLTGYAVFEPQDALLLDADARGVLTVRDGVPVLASHDETGRGGPAALADLAVPGPYHVELYAVDPTALPDPGDRPDDQVPPGMPAERLAGDPALADRTRDAAPDDLPTTDSGDAAGRHDAVEAFLDDEEKIAAIREQAREEAERRAEEWGFSDLDGE
ncbi:hypothetical protein ACFQH6_04475 [Halobacteriaceae archaeon GCM10025711]